MIQITARLRVGTRGLVILRERFSGEVKISRLAAASQGRSLCPLVKARAFGMTPRSGERKQTGTKIEPFH